LVFGLAGQAHAVSLGWTGTFAIQLATLDPVVIPGAGTSLVNGSGAAGHLNGLTVPASPFATTGFVLPVTDTVVFPIAGVQVTAHNANGAFAGSGGSGSFGGQMPINGAAKICLFGTCGAAVSNLSVPLTVVGQGGQALVTGAVNLTVIGAPWTTGTAAVGVNTVMGGVNPASNTGAPSGTVTLVTPIFVSTNIGASAIVPGFGIMTLQFVPEPGTLMLLGSGIAGLVAFGRSRVR
jgi:hypothetical protein